MILRTKYTGRRRNDFSVRAQAEWRRKLAEIACPTLAEEAELTVGESVIKC